MNDEGQNMNGQQILISIFAIFKIKTQVKICLGLKLH